MSNILLAIASGIVLSFSFPNFIEKTTSVHTAFFIWFAYVPLFIAVFRSENRKNAFGLGLITGVVFYFISLYWLWFVKPMGAFAYLCWFLLSLHLSLFIAVSTFCAKYLEEKFKITPLFSLPVLFTITEYVREWLFTGFPLLTPAQSQHQYTFILQLLKITGVHGLNFLIVMINTIIAYVVFKRKIEKESPYLRITTAISFILIVFMAVSNLPQQAKETKKVTITLLQRNLDQNVRWDSDYRKKVFDAVREMLKPVQISSGTLVIWPETGYPGVFNTETGAGSLVSALSGGKAYNLVGSDSVKRHNKRNRYYNSAFLAGPDGRITGEYSKYHLVPFGEYVPLQELFPFVDKVVRRFGYESFSRGKKIEPMEIEGVKFGALICYDSLFPEIAREYSKKGAKFLAHLSYESWYGDTQASAQIFTNTVLRAVENNLYIARCVESGSSGIIDNRGRVLKETGLFTRDVISAEIPVDDNSGRSFYVLAGDWFVWLLMAMITIVILYEKRKNARTDK